MNPMTKLEPREWTIFYEAKTTINGLLATKKNFEGPEISEDTKVVPRSDYDRLQEACKVMEEAIRDVKNESLKYGLKNSHRNEQIGSLCDEALAKAKEILGA